MTDDAPARWSEPWWQRALAHRQQGIGWKTVCEQRLRMTYNGSFTAHLKEARLRGWLPAEEDLPPPIRRDGKRVGRVRADPAPASLATDLAPAVEVSGPLSPAEVQTLQHYEEVIAQGIKTFVQVGQALLAIRDQRLYRQQYGTFEEYLRQRWDLGQSRAYPLMDAAGVVTNLKCSTIVELPTNEAQARPLAALPAEQQAEAWQEAVATAPAGKVTAKHVQATAKRVKERAQNGHAATPKPTPLPSDMAPEKPLRIDLQERLFEALKSLPDRHVFALFVGVYQWIEKYAIRQDGEIRGASVRENLRVIHDRLTRATWLSQDSPDYWRKIEAEPFEVWSNVE
jgi:hypothetical protein